MTADESAHHAQATIAAALGDYRAGTADPDLLVRLERVLQGATWHSQPPSDDIASFAATWHQVAFAYCGPPPTDLSDADVALLAPLWQQAMANLEAGSPNSVIRIETDSAADASRFTDLAEQAGAEVAVHAHLSAPSATWSWPLRVGVMGAAPGTDDVRASYPLLSEIVVVDDMQDAEVDVLVLPDDPARASLAARNIRAGLTIVGAGNVAAVDEIRAQFGSFAALFLPTTTGRGWWYDLLTELAHDAPLDVAARSIPGSVLVSDSGGLRLTSVRTYVATLLGASEGVAAQLPDVAQPDMIAAILRGVPFDHESMGATVLANAVRDMAGSLPVTIHAAMAEAAPPDDALEDLGPGDGDGDGGDGGPEVDDGRPGKAWPRLDAPAEVAAGDTFDIVVGLRTESDPGVRTLIARDLPKDKDVVVTVVVDGFALVTGQLTFAVNLSTTAARTLTLRAVDDKGLRAERQIGAQFTVNSELRAYAMRDVLVGGATPAPEGTVEREPDGPAVSTPLATADTAPATLELTLQQGSDLAGLVWLWRATSGKVELPDTAPDDLRTTLDKTATDFQQSLVREGSLSTGTPLYDRLVSTGRHLADKLPDAVIAALRAAAAATHPEPPSVLLISGEARIPWELAVIEPPITPSASPFLCAQVRMGRWLVGTKGKPAAKPSVVKEDRSRAVVVGDYSGLLTWRELKAADTEAGALITAGATALAAERKPVRDAVHGTPPVDVLHFAMHGKFSEGAREEGLVLVNRSGTKPKEEYFTPGDVGGGTLPQAPFVFLNACQVGAGQTVLGDYAGMAAEFLRIGATAVVAPLWEVDDGIAAKAAQEFYAATDSGTTVGAAVSALRGKFTEDAAAAADTAAFGSYLAYQFFGHPNLTLRKESHR